MSKYVLVYHVVGGFRRLDPKEINFTEFGEESYHEYLKLPNQECPLIRVHELKFGKRGCGMPQFICEFDSSGYYDCVLVEDCVSLAHLMNMFAPVIPIYEKATNE
jgi:hypothetical protein